MEVLEVLLFNLLLFLNPKLTVIGVTVSFLFSLNERPEKKPFIFHFCITNIRTLFISTKYNALIFSRL